LNVIFPVSRWNNWQLHRRQQSKQVTSSLPVGKAVRYIRTTFVPGEAHCMCLFDAANPELVKEVNDAAQIPYTKVIEALDLTPQ
jgi:hypothetical protein